MYKIDDCHFLIRLISFEDIALYMFQEKKSSISYPVCFTARTANSLYKLVCAYKQARYLSMYHYLYLGKEIYKAEQSLFLGQQYIQN